jgi:CNT family concentrative nucleoside transporter
MTKSEMMSLMTGGMATIAGSVLAAFLGFIGTDMAKHLLCASIMSAPAAILCAKILVPETEKFSDSMEIKSENKPVNALEAIVNGTGEGLKLAVNVAAMLLVFVAMVFALNFGLEKAGAVTGINDQIAGMGTNYDVLSFQFIAGYIFAPIAWMIGISSEDMIIAGQLLGEKTVLNEFVAYITYGGMKEAGAFTDKKSMIMCTYILCGFANFSSVGIQIGGIGALVPSRKGLLSKLGMKALIGGTLACLFTAAIVGMFY